MTYFLVKLWKMMRGTPQWYILWLFHDKFIVGVSGAIFDEQRRVLLLRHRYWRTGSWGLPGGYANREEKMEETLCREVKEETGLDIHMLQFLRFVSGYKLRLEVNYVGLLLGGNLQLDPKEVIEARFFATDDLPVGLLPSHKEVVALALASVKENWVEQDVI